MGQPDPIVLKLASSITLILMLGGVLLWCKHSSRQEKAADSHDAGVAVPVAVPSPKPIPSAAGKPVDPCDAEALWFATVPDIGPSEFSDNRKKAVSTMAAWSAECRQKAMAGLCAPGCDDLITDMIIDAEPDPKGRLELVRVRRDKNVETLAVSLKFIAKVKKFVAHAKGLSAVPRGDVGCIARMMKDFATIDSLTAELNQISGANGVAVLPTRGTLSYAKNCVNCADDRSLCADMLDDDKTTDENVEEVRKLIRKDTTTLVGKAVAK